MEMSNEQDFHRRLDRFMRDKIDATLRENPYYFRNRIFVIEALEHLSCIEETQQEKIECIAQNDGSSRAVIKLIDTMKRYCGFAFQFLKSLEASGHLDIAEELLQGLQIDRLPPGDKTNFIRKLARCTKQPVSSPQSHNSSGNVLNDLELEQRHRLNKFVPSQTCPPPYQLYNTSTTMSIPSPSACINVVASVATTDNNDSFGMSLPNLHDSTNMSAAATGINSNLMPSSTIREPTGVIRAEDNLTSKPEDGGSSIVSDVHSSEIMTSAGTVMLNPTNPYGESSPPSYSEYEGTRYDAIVPVSSNSNHQRTLAGTMSVPVNEQQTAPKQVATEQHSQIVQNHVEPAQSNSWQKPSNTSTSSDATMLVEENVVELPVKDDESSKKPVDAEYNVDENEIGVTEEAFENSGPASVQENHDTLPDSEVTTVIVACLAAVSIAVLVMKRLNLLRIE